MSVREPGGMEEPSIRIEGVELSFAQAMATRVAVELYMLQLEDAAFRAEMGPVADGYRARLREVRALMASGTAGGPRR